MSKEQRSNKWAFLFYKESAPENYLEILKDLHIPFVLSPWHDKDINRKTGELKKAHKHGAFFFDSLKSYTQVSELIKDKLKGPAHVEPIMSPKGMYDYFVHAENPEKSPYDIKDIETGCGFELDKKNFTEFNHLVRYAREENSALLRLIVDKTYFFAKYLDSRRYSNQSTCQSKLEKKG